MKKMIILLLVLPLFGLTQNKTLINVSRYFPKPDQIKLFEKNLALHAQQYHTGDYKWRVYSIETGPDAGGYMIVEGTTNWDGVDKRGNLGDAHMKDWETKIQPTLSDKGTVSMYLTFREDLATVLQGEYSDKISISHLYYKPGYYGETQTNIQSLKKLWQADGTSMAVYEASLSGEPQFLLVTRYKAGLKDRDVVLTGMPTRYNAVNGEGSFAKYISSIKESIDRQWLEILFHKPALDSK